MYSMHHPCHFACPSSMPLYIILPPPCDGGITCLGLFKYLSIFLIALSLTSPILWIFFCRWQLNSWHALPKKMNFLKLTTVSHKLHTVFSYFTSLNQMFITKSEMNVDSHVNDEFYHYCYSYSWWASWKGIFFKLTSLLHSQKYCYYFNTFNQ